MLEASPTSMSPFLHDRMVLRPMNTIADADAAVGLALRVEQTVVVDDDIAADVDLVRMAEHDVLTEHDIAAAQNRAAMGRGLAKHQTECARAACASMTTNSCFRSAPMPGRPTTRSLYLARGDFPRADSWS